MAKKILVADSNPDILGQIDEALKSNYTLILARSDSELFEKLSKEAVDLILLNYNLGDLPVDQLIKKVKGFAPVSLIFVLKAANDNINLEDLVIFGVHEVVDIPIDIKALLSLVGTFLESSSIGNDWQVDEIALPPLPQDEVIFKDFSNLSLKDELPPVQTQEKMEQSNFFDQFLENECPPIIDDLDNIPSMENIGEIPPVIGETVISETIAEPPVINDIPPIINSENIEDLQKVALDWTVPPIDKNSMDFKNISTNFEETATDIYIAADLEKELEKEINKAITSDVWGSGSQDVTHTTVALPGSTMSKEEIQALVNEYVAEYCKSQVERIAWEIIPDLAENLIRKELKKIAESL